MFEVMTTYVYDGIDSSSVGNACCGDDGCRVLGGRSGCGVDVDARNDGGNVDNHGDVGNIGIEVSYDIGSGVVVVVW